METEWNDDALIINLHVFLGGLYDGVFYGCSSCLFAIGMWNIRAFHKFLAFNTIIVLCIGYCGHTRWSCHVMAWK